MTKRSDERLKTLAYLLVDGLHYSWFECSELDESTCTATIFTDEDEEGTFEKEHKIGPDDIARGLRLYEEALDGKREFFKGEWKYAAKDAVRAGIIADESEFVGTKHNVARADSYARQTILFGKTNGAAGDYDANTADAVLQFAIFGETIFG
jgi:hypothetical protein